MTHRLGTIYSAQTDDRRRRTLHCSISATVGLLNAEVISNSMQHRRMLRWVGMAAPSWASTECSQPLTPVL